MRKLLIGSIFGCVFLAAVVNVHSQPLTADECVRRLLSYDIQQDSPILKFEVSVISVTDGSVRLKVYPRQESGYRSPISDQALAAVMRGETITSIFRRDRSVALLVPFEQKVKRMPGVMSVSWTAEKRCAPGFVCGTTGGWLTENYISPCSNYRGNNLDKGTPRYLGIYRGPLDQLIPARIGAFKLMRLYANPIRGSIGRTGGYYATATKALEFEVWNFNNVQETQSELESRMKNMSNGPLKCSFTNKGQKMKGVRQVGSRYIARCGNEGDVGVFWTNGTVLVWLGHGMGSRTWASMSEILALENMLVY
jgi:hypothetical protein